MIAIEKDAGLTHPALEEQSLAIAHEAERHFGRLAVGTIGLAHDVLQIARVEREDMTSRALLGCGRSRRGADPEAARLLLFLGDRSRSVRSITWRLEDP